MGKEEFKDGLEGNWAIMGRGMGKEGDLALG